MNKNQITNNLKKFFKVGSLVFLANILINCSGTPNNISISVNQGQCVQASFYNNVSPPTGILNNPQTAPYCMAITLQNNNKGINANNVQITNPGLMLSYSVGSNNYSSSLYDPVAAQVSISGSVESLGNISLYDPSNCATTQGAQVISLGHGGGKCTFYLQVNGESNPVGTYPMNITYNYTNGNQNFNVSTTINQQVNLYAGGPGGLFQYSSSQSGSSFIHGPTVTGGIVALARDNYGNIYIVNNLGNIFQYNGLNVTQLTNPPTNQITSITTDESGIVYIGTNQGIYAYSSTYKLNWTPFVDINNRINQNSNIINVKGYELPNPVNVLYVTQTVGFANAAYRCTPATNGWNCTMLINNSPSVFNYNSLALDINNNLYIGSENQIYAYDGSEWQPRFTLPNISGLVSSISWMQFNNYQFIYFGEATDNNSPLPTTESSAYWCSITSQLPSPCYSLISNKGSSVNGNIKSIAVDSGNNVFVVGGSLSSADTNSANGQNQSYVGLYLSESANGNLLTPLSSWNAITGEVGNSYLQTLKISTFLTSN